MTMCAARSLSHALCACEMHERPNPLLTALPQQDPDGADEARGGRRAADTGTALGGLERAGGAERLVGGKQGPVVQDACAPPISSLTGGLTRTPPGHTTPHMSMHMSTTIAGQGTRRGGEVVHLQGLQRGLGLHEPHGAAGREGGWTMYVYTRCRWERNGCMQVARDQSTS